MTIQEEAGLLLHEHGLLAALEPFGEAVVTGSYSMHMMAWNDLDLYIVENENLFDRWFSLAHTVCDVLQAVKAEVQRVPGRLFLGLETEITGTRWNIDIWAKDAAAVEAARAYCARVRQRAEADPAVRTAILSIKKDLIARRLYGFDKFQTCHYHSDEIYTAVLEENIRTAAALLERYPKS